MLLNYLKKYFKEIICILLILSTYLFNLLETETLVVILFFAIILLVDESGFRNKIFTKFSRFLPFSELLTRAPKRENKLDGYLKTIIYFSLLINIIPFKFNFLTLIPLLISSIVYFVLIIKEYNQKERISINPLLFVIAPLIIFPYNAVINYNFFMVISITIVVSSIIFLNTIKWFMINDKKVYAYLILFLVLNCLFVLKVNHDFDFSEAYTYNMRVVSKKIVDENKNPQYYLILKRDDSNEKTTHKVSLDDYYDNKVGSTIEISKKNGALFINWRY